jgi:ferredoxin-NADP reductase
MDENRDKNWHIGTLVKKEMAAENVMALTFSLPDWQPFQPGQHFDIRLTAPNGYQAERSYSIGSAPEQKGTIEYGIQLLEDGEVSPYLWNLKEGRQIEMRGPIGGHFIWNISMPGPLILIGGGSGMVPLMSMLRHHINNKGVDAGRKIVFLISARTLEFVLYRQELEKISAENPNIKIAMTITDTQPIGWTGYSRRIDKDMLKETIGGLHAEMPMTYICGPTKFVEAVAKSMIELEFNPHLIKTERFG